MPLISRKRRVVEDDAEDGVVPEEEVRNTQRRRRGPPPSDDPDKEEENGDNQARDEIELDAHGGEDSQDQLVKKLVRYALACEYSRQHIKRDGIREKVFGKHKAPFQQVFGEAQIQLRNKFGMEMVELPLKEKITLKERRGLSLLT